MDLYVSGGVARSSICQCTRGGCSRINAFIMREIMAPPNVMSKSGAYAPASPGRTVEIMRSIVEKDQGVVKLATLSVRTTVFGNPASCSICRCKTGSGA